jgi:hypothetical protein
MPQNVVLHWRTPKDILQGMDAVIFGALDCGTFPDERPKTSVWLGRLSFLCTDIFHMYLMRS